MRTEQNLLALAEGYRLGKYVVEGILGSGGFGITYLAEDTSLGRRVAIKELLPGDFATRVGEATVAPKGRESDRENLEWARARFIEEGRVLAACTHPNFVEVYEAFAANGTAYLVTRYEGGQDLERWLRELGRAPSSIAGTPPVLTFTPVPSSSQTSTPTANLPITLMVPGDYGTIQAAINAARPGNNAESGISIDAASPVLGRNELKFNKRYGLGFSESAKPKLLAAQIYQGNEDGDINRQIKFH